MHYYKCTAATVHHLLLLLTSARAYLSWILKNDLDTDKLKTEYPIGSNMCCLIYWKLEVWLILYKEEFCHPWLFSLFVFCFPECWDEDLLPYWPAFQPHSVVIGKHVGKGRTWSRLAPQLTERSKEKFSFSHVQHFCFSFLKYSTPPSPKAPPPDMIHDKTEVNCLSRALTDFCNCNFF